MWTHLGLSLIVLCRELVLLFSIFFIEVFVLFWSVLVSYDCDCTQLMLNGEQRLEDCRIGEAVKNAVLAFNGDLTERFSYISSMRGGGTEDSQNGSNALKDLM